MGAHRERHPGAPSASGFTAEGASVESVEEELLRAPGPQASTGRAVDQLVLFRRARSSPFSLGHRSLWGRALLPLSPEDSAHSEPSRVFLGCWSCSGQSVFMATLLGSHAARRVGCWAFCGWGAVRSREVSAPAEARQVPCEREPRWGGGGRLFKRQFLFQ